ncbi:uncharacterized protein N7500_005733 [Penicillium coprophilum]|uniref:uncharacterized protein n=1 Tax=Penicillium coprophilum TaxID=36646 RepID=UPI00239A1301|nr:uncharacterized protein N7500_005733 [Penicillium coprophilum]KAJ5163903.1 hypothetical protein N7500_005733 [Penicillium coprophilum]
MYKLARLVALASMAGLSGAANISDSPEGLRGYNDDNVAVRTLMIVFTSIALYNALELFILLFLTFTRYRGLYFWTLLLSVVLGVIPHAIGYLLGFFSLAPLWLSLTISTIGFYVMVPGQSIVLYSRLHLVVQSNKVLRFVLWLIIIDAIILLIPTTVLTFCTAYAPRRPAIHGYSIMERLQLAWFCAQEILISGIYITETVKLLRMMPDKDQRRSRIMYELLAINLVIILLDTTLKAMVYSIKLKLEFSVLGKLVNIVQNPRSQPTSSDFEEYPGFVDPTQITTDVTHAAPRESQQGGRRGWNTMSVESLPSSEHRIRPSTQSTDNSTHPS